MPKENIYVGTPREPSTVNCEWCGMRAIGSLEFLKSKRLEIGQAKYIYYCKDHEGHARKALGYE